MRGGKSIGPINTDNMLQIGSGALAGYGVQLLFAKDFIESRYFHAKKGGHGGEVRFMQDLLGMLHFSAATLGFFAVSDAKEPFKTIFGKIMAVHWSVVALYFGYQRFVNKQSAVTEGGSMEALLVCGILGAGHAAIYF